MSRNGVGGLCFGDEPPPPQQHGSWTKKPLFHFHSNTQLKEKKINHSIPLACGCLIAVWFITKPWGPLRGNINPHCRGGATRATLQQHHLHLYLLCISAVADLIQTDLPCPVVSIYYMCINNSCIVNGQCLNLIKAVVQPVEDVTLLNGPNWDSKSSV